MRHHFTVAGNMVELPFSLDHIAVRFDDSASHGDRRDAMRKAGLGSPHARVELPGEKFTICKVAPVAVPRLERNQEAIEATRAHPSVVRVAHVYGTPRARVVATDRITVSFKSGRNALAKILKEHRLTVLAHDGDEYLLQLHPGQDPLALSAEVAQLEAVAFAEPDFVTFGERVMHASHATPRSAKPNLYPLKLTRTPAAWKLCRGAPAVRIAIVDEGVQTKHPSLRGAIAGMYDATHPRSKTQEPLEPDWHGTGCAGLAVGIDAPGGATIGVGAGCSMLAVRMGYTVAVGSTANGVRRYVTKCWWIKDAIDWAWKNGADVISNSWSGGTASAVVMDAFERARTRGRGGKGCVIVVSAGNDDGPVEFPGTTKGALAVAASNQFDQPKTPTSRDNQRWWGSNYGPEVGIAAPGVTVFTTDNLGLTGLGPPGFALDFSGTSASTPMVAGAAALVLSANPALSETDVRQILCDTADKVGNFDYHGGRNDRMGHGRLNVLRAVKAALAAKGRRPKRAPARKRTANRKKKVAARTRR